MRFWSRSRPPVRAAGVLLFRDGRVLLIHRPNRDDWSFPKGKHEAGETDEECALREVEEETGLRCALEEELPSSRYVDRRGRPKLVRYWRLAVVGGVLEPASEADAARWLRPDDAARLLTYEADRRLLANLSRR